LNYKDLQQLEESQKVRINYWSDISIRFNQILNHSSSLLS
jgi:hypothetical protein